MEVTTTNRFKRRRTKRMDTDTTYSRTVPFGYKLNEEDSDLLDPIPYELEAIELARKYVNQYSYREVANWLTTKTGRTISHVGLRKRLIHEQQRKNKARTLRKWSMPRKQSKKQKPSKKAEQEQEPKIKIIDDRSKYL